MQNVDELCIKYLMDELDPSEKILVEKKMREDPNVLIEIESLRSTLKKLDALPFKNPPGDVVDRVCQIARERKVNATKPIPLMNSFGSNARYWGAAAAIVLSFSVGTYFLFSNNSQPANLNAAANTEVTTQKSNQANSNVQPWVDHNNILYIQANNTSAGNSSLASQAATSSTDSVFMQSMKKLTPLNGTMLNAQKPLDLHLASDKQE